MQTTVAVINYITLHYRKKQESPANARGTRDSSACMKTPMVEN